MEKNRLFIIISAAVAILGTFLPWYTTVFGVISISRIQNSGWIVIVLSIGSIVLACLNNINTPLNKTFSTIIIVAGFISTLVSLFATFKGSEYTSELDGLVSIGFGLILALIASIAIVVTGLLAMSGGKITKGTFEELSESGKGFAQSVGRVTTSTVKTAVNEIKKESHEHTEGQADQPVEAPKDPNQSEQ